MAFVLTYINDLRNETLMYVILKSWGQNKIILIGVTQIIFVLVADV
jgi:hypothetical protein